MLSEVLYFTDLTFKLIYLQKVTGLREVRYSTYILKGPFPSSIKEHPVERLLIKLLHSEIHSQVNCEYHGLFHPLETEIASAHCFPHPSIILHMAFKVYPLLCQYVCHFHQFVSTQSHSPPCMTLSLSQLTCNCFNETLLRCLKATVTVTSRL